MEGNMEISAEVKAYIPKDGDEWGGFYNRMKASVMRKLEARGIGYHDAEDAFSEAITKVMGLNSKRHLEKPLEARTDDGWVNWLALQARSIVHDAYMVNGAWTPTPDGEPIVSEEMSDREKSEAKSKARRIEGLYVEMESKECMTETAVDENERHKLLATMVDAVAKEAHAGCLTAAAYRDQVLNGWSPKMLAERIFKVTDAHARERKCNAIRMAKSRLDKRLREKVLTSVEFEKYFDAA